MSIITIPTGTNSCIRIPSQPEKTEQPVERIGFSMPEAAEALGISIPTLLPLIKSGTIRTVRLGKRVIVSVQSLRDFVDGTENRKSDSANADTDITEYSVGCRRKGE
jgi:excisionase family DNA binding protein